MTTISEPAIGSGGVVGAPVQPPRLPISFEFFPPRTPEGSVKLAAVRQALYIKSPQYCSITYGAGGSTQSGTFSTVRAVMSEGQDAACHLTCIGADAPMLRDLLAQLRSMGVRRIVALRGDVSSLYGMSGFDYARDLVAFIRAEHGEYFHIEVAAYPEMHPQALSPQKDLQAFVEKVKEGANGAITQYFYNPDAYFAFVDAAQKAGVEVPIVPGVMPILSSSQLIRFSDMCGADIPRWIRLKLLAYGDDTVSIKAFGHEVVLRMCERLIAGGVPSIHFYTMNQAEPVLQLCEGLNL